MELTRIYAYNRSLDSSVSKKERTGSLSLLSHTILIVHSFHLPCELPIPYDRPIELIKMRSSCDFRPRKLVQRVEIEVVDCL